MLLKNLLQLLLMKTQNKHRKSLLKIQQNDSIKIVGENKIKFDVTSNNIADYKRNIEEVFFTISDKKFLWDLVFLITIFGNFPAYSSER